MYSPPAESIEAIIVRARDTLLAAALALPKAAEVDALREELAPGLARGWFRPSEAEEIQRLFARYLHVRAALLQTLGSLQRLSPRLWKPFRPPSLPAFVTAWLAACMLMRSARYVIRAFHDQPQVRKLLNQPDPLVGIPANMLDLIQSSALRPSTLLRFLRAAHFAETHAHDISGLRNDPVVAPLLALLDAESPFIEQQFLRHAEDIARHRLQRIRDKPAREYRKVMWGIFETSGRVIADMRNPFHRKRVNRRVRHQVAQMLQPGDILITRHDDALSNLFLPGFWPHAAWIIGHADQREALSVHCEPERAARCRSPICILEAKKDGVRFRALRETLKVDAFLLLRPRYSSDSARRSIVERSLAHEGKLYDFEFDFTRSDRLVCSEVVYRALDGMDGFHFTLHRRAGRYALSAEDLLRQGRQQGRLDILLLYGLSGNTCLEGSRAAEVLDRSLSQITNP